MIRTSNRAVRGVVLWQFAVKVDCRFVYDLATLERRKSKLPLKFPPFLDMRPFVAQGASHFETDDESLYELRGVLLHKGPSAYHGHYEAQVYDEM